MMIRITKVGVDVRDEEGGTRVASGTAVILGPFNLLDRPTKTFTLYNQSALTLSGAVIQVNPDRHGVESDWAQATPQTLRVQIGPNPALWQSYDTASFTNLAAGQVRSVVANDLFRWWRILGVNRESTAIAVSGWLNASTI